MPSGRYFKSLRRLGPEREVHHFVRELGQDDRGVGHIQQRISIRLGIQFSTLPLREMHLF